MSSNIGYKTYYSGVQLEIVNCSTIALAITDEITQTTFKQQWYEVQSNSIIATKNGTKFTITDSTGSGIKFNTIFYIDNTEEVIGATKFDSVQTTELTSNSFAEYLIITIGITDTPLDLSDNIDISINLDLSNIKPKYNNRITCKEAIDYYNNTDNYVRYTSDILQLISDDSFQLITSTSYITSNYFGKLNLLENIPVSSFDKYWFTYYNNKPVVIIFDVDSKSYKLFSLVDCNDFNKPLCITSGTIDTSDIDYAAGNYLINSDHNTAYDIINKNKFVYNEGIYIDQFNSKNKLHYTSEIDTTGLSYIPNENYTISRRVGDWVVWDFDKYRIWTNNFGCVWTSISEKIFPVNNRVLISQWTGTNKFEESVNCTSVYCCTNGNTLKTESYYNICYPNSERKQNNANVPVKIYQGSNNMSSYYGYYIFTWNNIGGLENNQLLDGFRKHQLKSYDIPEFAGALSGILYYIDTDDNYIKIL